MSMSKRLWFERHRYMAFVVVLLLLPVYIVMAIVASLYDGVTYGMTEWWSDVTDTVGAIRTTWKERGP